MEHKDSTFEIETKAVNEDGTFKGLASTFGGEPDAHGDVIMPGAFGQSLVEGGRNKNGVMMLRGHNSDSIPGVWTSLVEKTRGLVVEGKLFLDTQLGKETHILMKNGALKGLSIGFDSIESESFKLKKPMRFRTEGRKIKKINLWEVSIVSFPANTRAKITSVKDFEGITDKRNMELLLRESGLTKNAALFVVSKMNLSESKDSIVDEEHNEKLLSILNNFKCQNILEMTKQNRRG